MSQPQSKGCSHCWSNPPNQIPLDEEYCDSCRNLRDDDYEIQLYEFYRDWEDD